MLDGGMTPEQILEELLGEFGLEINDTLPTRYHCNCSRERIEKALISIGKKDLQEMINDGEPIEVGCQFCDKKVPGHGGRAEGTSGKKQQIKGSCAWTYPEEKEREENNSRRKRRITSAERKNNEGWIYKSGGAHTEDPCGRL